MKGRKNIVRQIGLLSLLLLLPASLREANADTLYLKNGRKATGKIVEETQDYVKIDCLNKKLFTTYKRNNIEKIERDAENPLAADTAVSGKDRPGNGAIGGRGDAQTIVESGFILYVPAGLENGRYYPLVIMFHPDGDAPAMIDLWKKIADEKKWILYASKHYLCNGGRWRKLDWLDLKRVAEQYPVDIKRILATGLGEGGTTAHQFSFYCPRMIAAVVTNAGRLNYPRRKIEQRARRYPHNKLAVFLISPADFNYSHLDADKKFLDDLGWKTVRFEYEGGAVIAPDGVFAQAADWLQANW